MTASERKDGKAIIRDQVFAMRDGWRCFVNGNEFGPWRSKAEAILGMEVEQRRAATRTQEGDR